MLDFLELVIHAIGRVLIEILGLIPGRPFDEIDPAWTWLIATCVVATFALLAAAVWLGHRWLYLSFTAAAFTTLGIVGLAAAVSKPRDRRRR